MLKIKEMNRTSALSYIHRYYNLDRIYSDSFMHWTIPSYLFITESRTILLLEILNNNGHYIYRRVIATGSADQSAIKSMYYTLKEMYTLLPESYYSTGKDIKM